MSIYKLIKCGQLYDGVNDEFQSGKEILVHEGKIIDIGANLDCPEGTQIFDLTAQTVTPGLIDSHVHIDYPKGMALSELAHTSNTACALHAYSNLQKTLLGGFTTIRGMNSVGTDRSIFEIARQQKRGHFQDTSRLIAARVMGSEGGHADASGEMTSNEKVAEAFKSDAVGSGADFFTRLVRNEIKYGSDFIKVMYSGGFFTQLDGPNDCQLMDDEIQAIIKTAHNHNRTCTAHCYGDTLINKLIDFGIDGIEHAALMTAQTARRLEASDTYVVPTFFPFTNIIYPNESFLKSLSPAMQAKLKQFAQELAESRKVILASKIRLGYGSDIVGTTHVAECWLEYASWIESGVEPLRILRAATFENARILNLLDEIGTIEIGKVADIAAFSGDINHREGIKNCTFVMKDGIVYKS